MFQFLRRHVLSGIVGVLLKALVWYILLLSKMIVFVSGIARLRLLTVSLSVEHSIPIHAGHQVSEKLTFNLLQKVIIIMALIFKLMAITRLSEITSCKKDIRVLVMPIILLGTFVVESTKQLLFNVLHHSK